jgi:hypothetical protein
MKVEDAYFKNGFYINPNVTRVKTGVGDNEIICIKDNTNETVFYQISTPFDLFLSDTNVRPSGIGIYLKNIINKINDFSKNPTVDENQNFEKNYPDLYEYIEIINNSGYDIEYSLKGINDAISIQNESYKNNINNLINNGELVKDVVYEDVLVDNKIKTITFEEYFNNKTGKNIKEFDYSQGSLYIIDDSNNKYKLSEDFEFELIDNSYLIPETTETETSETSETSENSDKLKQLFK